MVKQSIAHKLANNAHSAPSLTNQTKKLLDETLKLNE